MKKVLFTILICAGIFCMIGSSGYAADPALDLSLKHEAERAIEKGLAYLRSTIGKDGSWSEHPGVTALVLRAFAGAPDTYKDNDGMMMKVSANYLTNLQKPDGSIFDKELPNYVTANAVIALAELNSESYAAVIKKAQAFLLGSQFDEGEGYSPDHDYYGGIGYGSRIRPDLSNLQTALEALKASGLPAEDDAWQKAVTFINRCQNNSETNDQDWAGNDGGFVYLPGESKIKGTHQSYGSMTYAGLKSFLYANVDKSDPRVQAAYDWIRENYTVEENPGMGMQGLFYSYNTFAKALFTYDVDYITGLNEKKHNWRDDLVEKLVAIQAPDGSWVNENNRWWESDKNLCTAYSIIALEYCLKNQER